MKQLHSAYTPFMESFFHHSQDAVSIIGDDSVFQYVNPAFEELYGLQAEDVVGKSVWTFWPENPGDFPWMASRIMKGDSVSEYETRRRRPDGTYVDVSLTISSMRDEDGNVFAYLTVGRDITERKRMENVLRDVEAKFRMIDEHISDAVTIFGPSGIIQHASSSHRSFLGIPPDVLIGGSGLELVHPDDAQRMRAQFIQVIREKTRIKTEFRLKHADGFWVDAEIVFTPMVNDLGEVVKVISVVRDVTDRRRTDELLIQAEKLSVVGQLGAALAHEVRNPLTTMKGFLQLMRKDAAYNANYMDLVLSELSRIEGIIEEFLATAKPRDSDYTRCDIGKILQQSVSMMLPAAHMNNLEIDFTPAPRALRIDGDEVKLKQVFVNLLKNSIESMESGGVITVTIEPTVDDFARILIVDQGSGISSDVLARLGNPFFTTKKQGTGLGLTVSLKILREHHAQVEFDSEVGMGTTVSIEIPIVSDTSA